MPTPSIQLLTRRVNNSWPAGITKAEVWPSVCTPLSPSVCTPHQILYSPALKQVNCHILFIQHTVLGLYTSSTSDFRVLMLPAAKSCTTGKSAVDRCDRKKDGLYQHCYSCKKFVKCRDGRLIEKDCAPDKVWDDIEKDCVWWSTTCSWA